MADVSTAGHIGIEWTRYLVSPSWKHTLEAAAPGSGPLAYNDQKAKKIAILMTDGEFNKAYVSGLNSTTAAKELCKRMKEDEIEVFTIGFKLTEAAAKSVMSECASSDTGGIQHYYLVADGAALTNAFQEIAKNAERLALTR